AVLARAGQRQLDRVAGGQRAAAAEGRDAVQAGQPAAEVGPVARHRRGVGRVAAAVELVAVEDAVEIAVDADARLAALRHDREGDLAAQGRGRLELRGRERLGRAVRLPGA